MPDLTPARRRHDPPPRREARLAYLLENDSLVNESNTAINRMTGFIAWILHESEAFICKALKGEVVVFYFEPLITQQMKVSGSPEG